MHDRAAGTPIRGQPSATCPILSRLAVAKPAGPAVAALPPIIATQDERTMSTRRESPASRPLYLRAISRHRTDRRAIPARWSEAHFVVVDATTWRVSTRDSMGARAASVRPHWRTSCRRSSAGRPLPSLHRGSNCMEEIRSNQCGVRSFEQIALTGKRLAQASLRPPRPAEQVRFRPTDLRAGEVNRDAFGAPHGLVQIATSVSSSIRFERRGSSRPPRGRDQELVRSRRPGGLVMGGTLPQCRTTYDEHQSVERTPLVPAVLPDKPRMATVETTSDHCRRPEQPGNVDRQCRIGTDALRAQGVPYYAHRLGLTRRGPPSMHYY